MFKVNSLPAVCFSCLIMLEWSSCGGTSAADGGRAGAPGSGGSSGIQVQSTAGKSGSAGSGGAGGVAPSTGGAAGRPTGDGQGGALLGNGGSSAVDAASGSAGGQGGLSSGSGGTSTVSADASSTGGQAGTSLGSGGISQGGTAGPSTGGQGGTSKDGGGSSIVGTADASTGSQADSGVPADFYELIEAETIPPNQIFGYAKRTQCGQTCAKPLTPGQNCCSGGGEVTWIVSANSEHASGWMQFNDIPAPADADYDVTVWYHCGLSDTYGDNNCGGQAVTETGQFGCRPHVFTVNGTKLPGAYHFPCFTGAVATIHAATITLPLAKGMNSLLVAPPVPRDAADFDAIEILPPGKGRSPRILVNTKDLLGK